MHAGNFFLKTHDFLQPLEKPGAPPPPEPSPAQQLPASGADVRQYHHQPVAAKQQALPLPGGVGTFTICPAPVSVARPAPLAAVVKAEPPPFVLWGQPTAFQHASARGTFTVRHFACWSFAA
jgi:hypothetical protein